MDKTLGAMDKQNLVQQLIDGRTDLVFDLIDAGISPSYQDEHGTFLIQWCAYYGDVSAIKFLLRHGAVLSELGENFDLNGASFHGHWRLVQFLLEQGANPNYPLQDTSETPLHAALTKANRPVYGMIVQLLLSNGANPNAVTNANIQTGAFMRDVKTKGETPLHRAAAFADYETISILLDYGADKSKKDIEGDTPLTWASWHLRPAKIISLLCYDSFSVHPDSIAKATSDHGAGWGNGMEISLLGKIHNAKDAKPSQQ